MAKKEFNLNRLINRFILGTSAVTFGTFLYFNFIGNQVEMMYQQNKFNQELIEDIPTLLRPVYRTSFWLPFRFCEVIYGNTMDKRPFIKYDTEILETPDGENLMVNWAKVHDTFVDDEEKMKNMPVVLLLPGLTGGFHSNYFKVLMLELRKYGFMPVIFNPRGTGVQQKSLDLFDYRDTARDIDRVVEHIRERFPTSNLYMAGFSLGSSYGISYVKKNPDTFKGMVCIANPIDVYKAAASLNSTRNRIYG
jgi:predicted alpha/beta-fold hydrolase